MANAGELGVSPVLLNFDKAGTVKALTISNKHESNALLVQIEVFKWMQEGGESHLDPSRDFLATPPIVEIPANDRFVVRVGARRFPSDSCESSYRIFVTEIPGQTNDQAPVKFRTRMSLPLFAKTASDCAPNVVWRREGDTLIATNDGNAHIKYQSIAVVQNGEELPVELVEVGYILPSATMRFAVPEALDLSRAFTLKLTSQAAGQERVNFSPRE